MVTDPSAPSLDDVLEAYAATDVDVWFPTRTRVAGSAARRDFPTRVVVITAWNPRSRPTDEATNRQANADLAVVLLAMGATVLPARGTAADGGWSEDSFAVPLDGGRPSLHTLLAVGRAFGQHAVYVIDDDHLYIVACAGGSSHRLPRVR